MNIIGTVVDIQHDQTIQKVNGGTYQGSRFTYRDQNGAIKEQNFTVQSLKFNPAIKNSLNQLKTGEIFTMVKEKEGEFWNVKGIYAGEGSAPSQAPSAGTTKAPLTPNASPKSNYETPEERAQKQVYIIRQSSFTSAMTLLGSKAKSVKDVLIVAKEIESYVFGVAFDDGSIYTMPNDDIDVD